MQSAYLSRSLFGSTRISFITAALFVGTLALAGNVGAQEPTSSQRPIPETPGLVEAAAGPGSGTSATCFSALTLGCRGGARLLRSRLSKPILLAPQHDSDRMVFAWQASWSILLHLGFR